MTQKQTNKKPRKIKHQPYRSFRLHKRVKNAHPKLPSSWQLAKKSLKILRDNWRLFGGIALVYAALQFLLVRGLAGGIDVIGTKDAINEAIGQPTSNAIISLTVFTTLLGTSGSGATEAASLYQTIITIICSLAIIWALRQTSADKKAAKLSVKQAFYQGMYPLVPLLLVLGVVILQLIPISIGVGLYNFGIISGFAATPVEQIIWIILALLLSLLSLYLVASSIFAAYIVTLPNVAPMQALRSARQLVQHRRLVVLRKLALLPLAVLILLGVVVVPLIAFVPAVADFVFFVLSSLSLPLIHAYIYNVYKSML